MNLERKQYGYDTLPKLLGILKGWHVNGRFEWIGNSYVKGVNNEAAEKLLRAILEKIRIDDIPLMIDSSGNADRHFTVPNEELDAHSSAEWEGINWGWQDCIKKISGCLPNITESVYKDTRL